MKSFICFAVLLFAVQATTKAEDFYLGFTKALGIDTPLEKSEIQCINDLGDSLLAFDHLLHTIDQPESLESLALIISTFTQNPSSLFPASCKGTIELYTRFLMVISQTTDIGANWQQYYPEIIQALGVAYFYEEIAVNKRTNELAGVMVAEPIKWLLGLSKPEHTIDTSSLMIDPTKIVPFELETFFPSFISGVLRSLYIYDKALISSLSQCAIDVTGVAFVFNGDIESLIAELITLKSCQTAQVNALAYWKDHKKPRAHDLKTTIHRILIDVILNVPVSREQLLLSVLKLSQGSYEMSGVHFGAVIRNAFTSLVPMKIGMPN